MTTHDSMRGYGNIYTPHAGSMIIQVQRENGLANRTIVLTNRQVRLLRFFMSKPGITAAAIVLGSWGLFATQAARVPFLTRRLAHMEHDAARIDTLDFALSQLQKRYAQVQAMLGVARRPDPDSAESPATSSATPSSTRSALDPSTTAPSEQGTEHAADQATPTPTRAIDTARTAAD